MKICFETFGCRLNRAEALDQEAKYLAAGHTITSSHKEADLIIVRGCSVTRRAQRDTEKLIEHLKEKYPLKHIKLEGCIEKKDKNPPRALTELDEMSAEFNRAVSKRTARAYLKVQDGCSGKCTFCIVPHFRGESRSVDFVEAIDKAKRFIDAGYHEIVVTGCNLSLYASEGKRLPELLQALATLSDDVRIRLGSLESWLSAKETIDVFAENRNICRFLHVPVQSGSNKILELMQRPYKLDNVEDIIRYALKRMPMISLGCDMITGFPGETEFDFDASVGLMKRLPFTNAHVFPYSERPGTLAVAFPGQVPREERKARAKKLDAIARETRHRFALKHVGQEVEIVVEDEKRLGGWTSDYLWCNITNFVPVKRKSLVKVRVMEAVGSQLFGIRF